MNTIAHRKSRRVNLVCQPDISMADQHFTATTENISLDVMYIKTDNIIPAGRSGGVSLTQGKAVILEANCNVVRTDSKGLGVLFKSRGL